MLSDGTAGRSSCDNDDEEEEEGAEAEDDRSCAVQIYCVLLE